MKLLVMGSGMMGSAAAYMARQPEVHSVTTGPTARPAARARWLLASTTSTEIRRYAPQPSTLPTRSLPVVRQALGLASKRKRPELRSRPTADSRPAWPRSLVANSCVASTAALTPSSYMSLAMPEKVKRQHGYQLVFSVEGLINEYVEPARILRCDKLTTIESSTRSSEVRCAVGPTA